MVLYSDGGSVIPRGKNECKKTEFYRKRSVEERWWARRKLVSLYVRVLSHLRFWGAATRVGCLELFHPGAKDEDHRLLRTKEPLVGQRNSLPTW